MQGTTCRPVSSETRLMKSTSRPEEHRGRLADRPHAEVDRRPRLADRDLVVPSRRDHVRRVLVGGAGAAATGRGRPRPGCAGARGSASCRAPRPRSARSRSVPAPSRSRTLWLYGAGLDFRDFRAIGSGPPRSIHRPDRWPWGDAEDSRIAGMPAAEQPGGKRELLISKTWLQVAGLVVLVGFFVLVLLAYRTYQVRPADPRQGGRSGRAGGLHRERHPGGAEGLPPPRPHGVRLDLRPRRLPGARLHR